VRRKNCAERRPKEAPLSLMWQGRFCIIGTLIKRDKEEARGVKKSKAAVENSRLGGMSYPHDLATAAFFPVCCWVTRVSEPRGGMP